jgi:hypothetical protein
LLALRPCIMLRAVTGNLLSLDTFGGRRHTVVVPHRPDCCSEPCHPRLSLYGLGEAFTFCDDLAAHATVALVLVLHLASEAKRPRFRLRPFLIAERNQCLESTDFCILNRVTDFPCKLVRVQRAADERIFISRDGVRDCLLFDLFVIHCSIDSGECKPTCAVMLTRYRLARPKRGTIPISRMHGLRLYVVGFDNARSGWRHKDFRGVK